MKKHEELRLLINSLDDREKNRFLRDLKPEQKAIYHAIQKGEKVKKHYRVNQLKDIIIDQMRTSYNSDEQRILQGIVDAKMFFYRGLHRLGFEALENAKEIAEELEKYEYLLVITTLETIVANNNQYRTKKVDVIEQGERRLKYTNILKNKSTLAFLRVKIWRLMRQSMVYFRKKESNSEIQLIENELQEIDPKMLISNFNLIDYLDVYRMIYLLKGNYSKVLEYAIKALEETKKNPNLMKASPLLLLRQISSVYIYSYPAKRMDVLTKTWEEIINIKTNNIKEETYIFQLVAGERLRHLMYTDSPNIRQELEETIKKYNKYLDMDILKNEAKLVYPCFFLIIYAFLKEYKKAEPYLTELLNNYEKKENFRTDVYQIALLVELSMFFEQEDFDTLKSLSHNAKRKFQKMNELYKPEHIVLNFFHSFGYNTEPQEQKRKLKKLINDLEDERERKKVNGIRHNGQFDWIWWAKRQL